MFNGNPEEDPDYIPEVITVYVHEPELEPQPPAYYNSRWFGPALVCGAIILSALVVTTCGTPSTSRDDDKATTTREVAQYDTYSINQ